MNNLIESVTAVYNDVELIGMTLESVKNHVDKIHIVEGSWFPNQPLRSTDGTLDVIEGFKKQNPDKVEIYYYDYNPNIEINLAGHSNPNAIANAVAARQMGLNNLKSDWYFMLDSDEIYKPEDLDNLIDMITILGQDNVPYTINVPAFVFYFSESFGSYDNFHRIFRILEHPPVLVTEDLFSFYAERPPERLYLDKEQILMYHYSYLTKKRVETKIKFYDNNIADQWYKDVFSKTMDGTLDLQENKNYHLFAGNGFERDYQKFDGTHPKIVQESLEKINSNT